MTILRSRSRAARVALCVLAALTTVSAAGCGDDDAPATDAGMIFDGGPTDGGGEADAGPPPDDGGADDAGGRDDAGADDAGADDAGTDAGGGDAGTDPTDAGTDAGDTTPIPAPRPLTPASTARTTSPNIRFRWALDAPATGARLDICRDPACLTVIETHDVDGAEAELLVPPDPLPSSRVFYWRLTGRDGARVGTAQSAIWSFSVHGSASSAAGGTWGSTYDLDGDGLAEVLGGAPGSAVVRIWRGRDPVGPSAGAANTEISGATPLALGSALAAGGDVNADGLGDLVVGGASSLYVFHGVTGAWPTSLNVTHAAATIPAPGPVERGNVAMAGDVDGDGYADLVVGDAAMGRIFLHRGGAAGLETTGVEVTSTLAGFGGAVAGGCDVNADGFSDVIVGGDDAAVVLFGAATDFGDVSTALTAPPSSAGFGASVACAGDVNGDGYPDVIVGAPEGHAAFVYHGSTAGIGTIAAGALRKEPGNPGGGVSTFHGDAFGAVVAAAGDVNGDELGDVVVVAPIPVTGTTGFFGWAFVFHGATTGLPVTAAGASTTHQRAFGSTPPENRITDSRLAGDVNGDGVDDVVSGAPFRGGGAGGVLLHVGAQGSGVPATQAWLIESGVLSGFGTTVARLWDALRAPFARET